MAYTYAAVTTPRVVKRVPGSPGLGLFSGKITISVYDQAHAEITEITSKFKSKVVNVVVSPVSTNGYLCTWDPATNSIKAFIPAGTNSAPTITTTTNAGTTTPVYTNGGALTQVAGATGITGVQAPVFSGGAATEAANGVNIGDVQFIALGVTGL